MYAVRRSGSDGWQGNYHKNLEGCKSCELYVSKKIQETKIMFSN